ncbi:MAG TPA: MBL fold metallo-hydrolase [Bacillota bacterium]|nr:MBL fold metallo-hydrolase [Bacillota bacterium]
MQLTVLGCYGPYPPAGGACSGYLLEESGYRLLIDCGNGVLSRLQQHLPFVKLDGVLISHLHSDHVSDLMIMRYGLEAALARGERNAPLPLYAPPEPAAEFGRLPYKQAYRVEPLQADRSLQLGPFNITFQETVHALPCLAMRLESRGAVLVYSADTEYYPELAGLARGADLFLCEANYQNEDMAQNPPNHLSAAQAAQIAAEAGVKRLLLTHLHPERELERSLQQARVIFPEVAAAGEGALYQVGP